MRFDSAFKTLLVYGIFGPLTGAAGVLAILASFVTILNDSGTYLSLILLILAVAAVVLFMLSSPAGVAAGILLLRGDAPVRTDALVVDDLAKPDGAAPNGEQRPIHPKPANAFRPAPVCAAIYGLWAMVLAVVFVWFEDLTGIAAAPVFAGAAGIVYGAVQGVFCASLSPKTVPAATPSKSELFGAGALTVILAVLVGAGGLLGLWAFMR